MKFFFFLQANSAEKSVTAEPIKMEEGEKKTDIDEAQVKAEAQEKKKKLEAEIEERRKKMEAERFEYFFFFFLNFFLDSKKNRCISKKWKRGNKNL